MGGGNSDSKKSLDFVVGAEFTKKGGQEKRDMPKKKERRKPRTTSK